MEQSKAMEYGSRKASSEVLKPRNVYIHVYKKMFATKFKDRNTQDHVCPACASPQADILFMSFEAPQPC